MAAEGVFLDANVLLTATTPARPLHARAFDRLLRLVEQHGCSGKSIHDANLVAVALVNGVTRLVTANVQDFRRFAAEIEVVDLAAVEEAGPT